VIALGLLAAIRTAAGQGGEAMKPAFEAASIKRNRSMSNSQDYRVTPGRLSMVNQNFREILATAYGLTGYQFAGAMPGWLGSETYDIEAKADDGVKTTQMMPMLQALLEERLHLKFHWATGEVQGFALTVAKGGPRFHEYQPKDGDTVNHTGGRREIGRFSGRNVDMHSLANYLRVVLQAPVTDQTELKGMYEIALEYSRDAKVDAGGDGGPPYLATALEEQLGLKLVKQKVPIQMFSIDRIERPAEN
jgi:uncharacterized protein (TIGR03435 family)